MTPYTRSEVETKCRSCIALLVLVLQVQWSEPDSAEGDYCDPLLYLTTFSVLALGWLVLTASLLVFLADKILTKLLCCRLCSALDSVDGAAEERVQLQSKHTIEY